MNSNTNTNTNTNTNIDYVLLSVFQPVLLSILLSVLIYALLAIQIWNIASIAMFYLVSMNCYIVQYYYLYCCVPVCRCWCWLPVCSTVTVTWTSSLSCSVRVNSRAEAATFVGVNHWNSDPGPYFKLSLKLLQVEPEQPASSWAWTPGIQYPFVSFGSLPEYVEQSERKNEQIPLFFPLLDKQPCSRETAITTLNLLCCILESAWDFIPGPCPRVRPGGTDTTQRACGENFKLSLPTGQSRTWNEKLRLKLMGGVKGMNVNVVGGGAMA